MVHMNRFNTIIIHINSTFISHYKFAYCSKYSLTTIATQNNDYVLNHVRQRSLTEKLIFQELTLSNNDFFK